MDPGYQGSINNDSQDQNKHNALAGDDFAPGMESLNPAQDEWLKDEVEKKLWNHSELNVSKVSVHAKNGFISITGSVDGEDAKATVEGLARSVRGVEDVVSLLEIHEVDIRGQYGKKSN
jgi:osmotically-inducible protein OsmY